MISALLILQGKYTTLLKKLDEALLLGNNAFPKKIPEAVSMMLKEETSSSRSRPRLEDDDADKESNSTVAVNNVIANPPDAVTDHTLDTSTDPSEGLTEAEVDDACIIAILLLNSNYNEEDYFDNEDNESIYFDDEPDNTDARVCMV